MSDRKEYEKLRKKYKNLPSWKWVEANFKLKSEDEWHVLEKIRYSINDKLTFTSKILIEPIISGGRDYSSYLERRMLTKREVDELFKIYKELQEMIMGFIGIVLDEFSEKIYVESLAKFKTRWDKLRPKVVKFCKKLSKEWKDFKKPEQNTAYHG